MPSPSIDAKKSLEPVQVIAFGPGRTGSVSLRHALEILLGGKCYHWNYPGMTAEEHVTFADDVLHGRLLCEDYRRIFSDYTAVCGSAINGYWRDLLKAYPKARIIILYRDPEKWFQSLCRTTLLLFCYRNTLAYYILLSFFRPCPPHTMFSYAHFGYKSIGIDLDRFKSMANNLAAGKEMAINLYKKFYVDIEKELKSHELPYIIFQVSDGWEPMCKFLNVPVPGVEFPHDVSHSTLMESVKKSMHKSVFIANIVKLVAVPLFLSTAFYYAWLW